MKRLYHGGYIGNSGAYRNIEGLFPKLGVLFVVVMIIVFAGLYWCASVYGNYDISYTWDTGTLLFGASTFCEA